MLGCSGTLAAVGGNYLSWIERSSAAMKNIHRFLPFVLGLFLFGLTADPLEAQLILGKKKTPAATEPTENPVQWSVQWNQDKARPGDAVVLAIVADIAAGYHINPDEHQVVPVGDFEPYPTSINVADAGDALTLERVRFPKPHPVKVNYADGDLYSFSGRTICYLPVRVGDDAKPGQQVITLDIESQACDDTNCLIPKPERHTATLEIVAADAVVSRINEELFKDYRAAELPKETVRFDLFGWKFEIDAASSLGFLLLLVVAALGGFLLNFTPCVLPVIPIKIIGLSQAAGNRARCFALGLTMSLGVVAFWLGLGLLVAKVADFSATNQLFQYPLFTISVGAVIAIMAVGMCGVFSLRLPAFVYQITPKHDTILGSFGFGIMTAVLSTPCTAPFMGAAAAWAATQQAATTLTTFAAIGVGMALPYLILSAFPDLVKKMPRSGPASELIKQVMGLLMLAAAAYFLGVGLSALLNTPPDPPSRAYWWMVMALSFCAGFWLSWRTFQITPGKIKRMLYGALGVVIMLVSIGGAVRLTESGPIEWVYFTPERFAAAQGEKKVVVVDFTAEWCLNCKALEETVLHSQRVASLLAAPDVVPIKVDLTGNYPAAKAKLKETGRLTIPLLVIYSPSGDEVFKSDFYTIDQVVEAIQNQRSSTTASARSAD